MINNSTIRILKCCEKNMKNILSEIQKFKTTKDILKNLKRIKTLNLRFQYYQQIFKRFEKEYNDNKN